jgi:hypothetical protein
MGTPAAPSAFFNRKVDAPVNQDANYRMSAQDRQYIDSQIQAIQQAGLAGSLKRIMAVLALLPDRPAINFGSGLAVADDPTNNVTTVTALPPTTAQPVFFAALATSAATTSRQTIFLDGYAAVGDGGGGLFVWAASSTLTPDSGTVSNGAITSGGVGRWLRDAATSGVYMSASWFGAIPSTMGGTKSTDAVMSAYAALPSSGGTIYIQSSGANLYYCPFTASNPAGLKFTTKPVRLLGSYGRGNWNGGVSPVSFAQTRIGSDSNGPVVWLQNPATTWGSSVEHIGIVGNAVGALQDGLVVDNRNFFASFVEAANCGRDGISIRDNVGGSLISCAALYNQRHGWLLDSTNGSTSGAVPTNNTIVNPIAIGNIGNGIQLTCSPGTSTAGNNFHGGNVALNGKSRTITGATNANPTVIACTAHGLVDGQLVNNDAIGGNTGANGVWFAKATGQDANHYAIYQDSALTTGVNTSAGGAYTSGGHALTGWGIFLGGTGIGLVTFNRFTGMWDENNVGGCVAFTGGSLSDNQVDFVRPSSGPSDNASGGPFWERLAQGDRNTVSMAKDLTPTISGTAQTGRAMFQTLSTGGGYGSSDNDVSVWRNDTNTDDGVLRMKSVILSIGLTPAAGTASSSLPMQSGVQDAVVVPWSRGITSANQAGSATFPLVQSDNSDAVALGAATHATNIYGTANLKKALVGQIQNPTYGTTVTADLSTGIIQQILATNGVAFTIANPTNATTGTRFTLEILNLSGGALGAISWGTNWLGQPTASFAAPANNKRRTSEFFVESGSAVTQIGTWSADM